MPPAMPQAILYTCIPNSAISIASGLALPKKPCALSINMVK